jgi:cytochrome c-type biogenesis protein CcmH/NrfF
MKGLEIWLFPIAFFLIIALIEIKSLQKETRKLRQDIFQEKLDRIKERK